MVFGETIVFPVTAGRAVQAHTTLRKVTYWRKRRPFGGVDKKIDYRIQHNILLPL